MLVGLLGLSTIAGCSAGRGGLVPPSRLRAGAARAEPRVEPGLPQSLSRDLPDRGGDPDAFLSLDEILPRPALGSAVKPPTTGPDAAAPLDALQLYARARAALVDNQRNAAINLLEKAVRLDPYSFELYYTLGKAYQGSGGAGEQAVAAFEKAAALRPDHLTLQYELGRQLLAKGDVDKALERLRLATQTTAYKDDEDIAALVDFFLARALHEKGYARASLDRYDLLLGRLRKPFASHANPELLYLISHPETLYVQIGELYERHGDYAQALRAYDLAARRDPENFDLQARAVRLLVGAGRGEEAGPRAAKLVTSFHASADALLLLKDVYHRLGDDAGATAALAKLQAEKPADRALLFALFDAMKASGRAADAENLLRRYAPGGDRKSAQPGKTRSESPADGEVVRRLFALYEERDDAEGAARLLVESLAADPDSLGEVAPLWGELMRPGKGRGLRLATLQKLRVAPEAEASRLYWVARIADAWSRDLLAQSALEQAAARRPPFAPAYRMLVERYFARGDWDDAQKARAVEALAESVKGAGGAALAAEIAGLSLLHRKQPDAAAAALAEAIRLGDASPDVHLMRAGVLFEQGHDAQAEQLLWKLVSDWPRYEDAYAALFGYYVKARGIDPAANVLRQWIDADPRSVSARQLQAAFSAGAGRSDVAQGILLNLFAEQPDNARVLSAMESFYNRAGKTDEFIAKLEDEHARRPQNRAAVEMLVDLYAAQKRSAEAARVLDATRAAVAGDADLLYHVAHLYERIRAKETTEQVLLEVLRLDPAYPPANNDLGYAWAEEGRNLDRAEALIRAAVDEEPDNQSYLDSLGWVSYKRGKFEQARTCLDRAIGPAARPDPVVLDHLGDVLYRLSHAEDAARQWKRSLQRLDEAGAGREDLKQLRLQLVRKLGQQDKGQPVDVAPVAAAAPLPPAQAQN